MQAHEALSRLMPRPDASPTTWFTYYRRSAAVYERVAEIDRGHFHEAMFWATRERERPRPSRTSQPWRDSNAALSPCAISGGIES